MCCVERMLGRGRVPAISVGTTALALLSVGFWLAAPMARALAGASVVTFRESKVYELGELLRLARHQTGRKIYADSRQHGRRVFVSRGTYELSNLLRAIQLTTGMSLRSVGETQFLTVPDSTLGGRLLFPLLPEQILRRLGEPLKPLAQGADLPSEGIPFSSRDFLDRRTVPFAEMSPDQQEFVVQEYVYQRAKESMESPDVLGRKARQELTAATLRLGASYLMVVVAYQPSSSPAEPDPRRFMRVQQVYYDYRHRFGVTLPEQ